MHISQDTLHKIHVSLNDNEFSRTVEKMDSAFGVDCVWDGVDYRPSADDCRVPTSRHCEPSAGLVHRRSVRDSCRPDIIMGNTSTFDTLQPAEFTEVHRQVIQFQRVTDSPPHFSSAPNPNLTLT